MKIDREIKLKECIYCGDIANHKHHYQESVSNSGKKRLYARADVLPACSECNQFFRNKEFLNISNHTVVFCPLLRSVPVL
jgi:5-methylcytosine-specific restriction endonuclease McrA